jgi:hypothetical protein
MFRNNTDGYDDDRDNGNHLKTIQKIPEQHTWKTRQQATTENSHVAHCAHTFKSANAKTQNVYHGK